MNIPQIIRNAISSETEENIEGYGLKRCKRMSKPRCVEEGVYFMSHRLRMSMNSEGLMKDIAPIKTSFDDLIILLYFSY